MPSMNSSSYCQVHNECYKFILSNFESAIFWRFQEPYYEPNLILRRCYLQENEPCAPAPRQPEATSPRRKALSTRRKKARRRLLRRRVGRPTTHCGLHDGPEPDTRPPNFILHALQQQHSLHALGATLPTFPEAFSLRTHICAPLLT